MIIIINGPLGIGKSELSWALLDLFERGVMLDGDYIGALRPFSIYDPERIEYLYQTLRLLVQHHCTNGYRNFVINYVFETLDSLDRLRMLLGELDEQVIAVRLVCDQGEIDRRIRSRWAGQDEAQLAWEMARARQLVEIQQQAAERGDMGLLLDTTNLDIRQSAQAVWDLVQRGK